MHNLPSTTCFAVDMEQHVAHIRLNQPERRNAMSLAFWDELPALIQAIEHAGEARCIVLSSTGPHFSAGLDLSVFQNIQAQDGNGFALYQKIRLMQRSLSALESCRLPVLAAVQGAAIGGAVDLLTACDLRYCSSDARFSIEEINFGMTADVGTFPRILNHLPEGVVREMAYLGQPLNAQRAESLGFVNAVLPDHESLLQHTLDQARLIASKAPLAVHGSKRAIQWARDHTTEDSLEFIALWNDGSLSWDSIQESMLAKKAGRPAQFPQLPPLPTAMSPKQAADGTT
ncbi:MAG: enoyl-CoA hydratase-related protein [Oceanococcaceae bacterium]